MDKMNELRAIGAIIESQKYLKNYAFNQAKESFTNHSANASLTVDNIGAINNIRMELAWMEQASAEMAKIKGVEAELSKIHHTISLGMSGMGNPSDEKIKELDQQWRGQLYDLKTKNPDFRTMMLEEAYHQEESLRKHLGISLSLDYEENANVLNSIFQEKKIDQDTYAAYMLGMGYLVVDPEFIAQHSEEQKFGV